jgi:hypothetical protein
MRELRWELWFENADDLWPAVREDLLAAYPSEISVAVEKLRVEGGDALDEAISVESEGLAERWRSSRHPAYRRRAVPSADVDTLASTAIRSAIPDFETDLADPLDAVEPGETHADLIDAAWGPGSSEVLRGLAATGAANEAIWREALRSAEARDARLVASLWQAALDPRALRRELSFFGRDWGDRALLVAASLSAVRTRGP